MSSKGKAAAAAKTTKILVAVGELRGGATVVNDGEELTAAKAKAIGLDEDAIAGLLERGTLVEVSARQAEGGGDYGGAALADAIARAEKAEGEVAELKKQLAEAAKKQTGSGT